MSNDPSADRPRSSDGSERRLLPPVLLVGIGGALGTAARALLSPAIPDVAGVPTGILVINLTGAFLLGLLLESLIPRGLDTGKTQRIRLFLGTGILGGFTSYSALASGTALLLHEARVFTGIGYALGTVILGAAVALLGVLIGRRIRGARAERHG